MAGTAIRNQKLPAAMADVEEDAPLAGLPHVVLDALVLVELGREASVEMGVYVARLHVLEDQLFVAAPGLGMEVHHQDGVRELSGLDGAVDRLPSRRAGSGRF